MNNFIEIKTATGKAYCKHHGRIIKKGELCFKITLYNPYYLCKDCTGNLYIELEARLKETKLYNEILIKSILE